MYTIKNYITSFFCLFVAGSLCFPALAKELPHKWERGRVYLENEVLGGEISYNPRHDVVFFREEDQIRTFTAHTVSSFSFFDQDAGITRTFSSLNPDGDDQPGKKEFYEIAVEGDLTLARKGRITRVKRARHNLNPLPHLVLLAEQADAGLVYDYYLKGENGQTEIRHFRKQVLPLMADREEEMHQFIGEFNFKFSNPLSYILLINYYNQIKKDLLILLP